MKCIHVVIGDPDGDGKLHLTDVLTAAGSARVPGVFRDHQATRDEFMTLINGPKRS